MEIGRSAFVIIVTRPDSRIISQNAEAFLRPLLLVAETCNDFRVGSSPTWLLRVRNKVRKGSMRIFHFNSLTKNSRLRDLISLSL